MDLSQIYNDCNKANLIYGHVGVKPIRMDA